MPKPKAQKLASPPAASPADSQASLAVIAQIVDRAKKTKGADTDLLTILEKHVLKADPKDNAADSAVSEIEALARKRAMPADQKP